MPRQRKHRKDLPECVYFKNGAYYLVKKNKWERLDSDYAKAMAAWSSRIAAPDHRVQTVSDLLDRYLIEVVPGKAARTQKDNREECRYLRAFFGEMGVAAVQPHHVAQYVAGRAARTRANREIALLSHAFNKARLWGLLAGPNPCSVPGTRNSEKARDRYVTDEEITEFKKEAPQWLRDYLDLKLLLGLRQQDMLALEWRNVTDEHLLVAPIKTIGSTGKKLLIQRTPELNEILARLTNDSPTLFATKWGTPYTSAGFGSIWRRVMAKYTSTGNQRFHEHDLRGKVATDIENPVAAQALLGHKNIAMTEAYIKARKTDVVQPHSRRKK